MRSLALPRQQRGVTLVIGLIMLVLITLMVTSAFLLSNTNLKSVGNMQFRDEAIAAANKAIEQVLGSPFTNAPAAEEINVDIDNDGTTDYVVDIATPTCVRASQIGGAAPTKGSGSSVSFGLPPGAPPSFNTVWDIDATVTSAGTGAAVRVRQGVRVLLSQVQKNAVCP
jgi:hypothetical protein